jgi:PAS domain S-box-containing protein
MGVRVLRGALRPSALLPGIAARFAGEARRSRALDEGRGLERALFLGRCIGGAFLILAGPVAVPQAETIVFYVFGGYFVAYAFLTLWISERASTTLAQRRAGWIAHVFDTFGFVGGLLISGLAPDWLVTNAAPLYIVIVAFRFGTLGAAFAVSALSIAHVAIAQWRAGSLGYPVDPVDSVIHIGIYVLAGLITAGIENELRSLRAGREMRAAVHEPLLQAHDDMRQGVLISEGARAVYVSDGLVALSGYARDEIMAMPSVYELLPPDERESARQMTERLPSEGGMLQKTLLRRDGQRVDIEVALRRYRVEGRMRTVSIIRDVTLRTRALAELERTHRLESLGSLAGGIAHDFNNLLAVILNNAHLALDGAGGASREIEEIRHAAERGAQLTRQMLVFSRGGTTAGELVDISSEVASAERLLRRAIGADVTLDVRLANGLPAVRLGPGQVEQILMNLAVNARDAMPAGGRLAISVDAVDLDSTAVEPMPALRPGRHVRIVANDTGTGMTPDVAARVFEPFFSTKAKGRGTGLGLSTVYGIVTRADGHIGVASTLGAGTRFTIHLPAFELPEIAAAGAVTPLANEGSGRTILLVDDEASVLRTTSSILRAAGYRVVEAASPSEALLAATRDFDLLVSDIVLPSITGRELAKRIREHHPALPVLFISGFAPEGRVMADVAFLAKPFTPEALLASVRDCLKAARTTVGVS